MMTEQNPMVVRYATSNYKDTCMASVRMEMASTTGLGSTSRFRYLLGFLEASPAGKGATVPE